MTGGPAAHGDKIGVSGGAKVIPNADTEVQKEKMLRPEDVAESVWEAVDKPNNVHVNDVLIRDAIQYSI